MELTRWLFHDDSTETIALSIIVCILAVMNELYYAADRFCCFNEQVIVQQVITVNSSDDRQYIATKSTVCGRRLQNKIVHFTYVW